MPEKYITANGIRLAYDDFGDTENPPMVLIMGLGTQMIAWPETMCEQLANNGYWVIRFDNRDIGLSEKMDAAHKVNLAKLMIFSRIGWPTRVPYTLRDMADDTIGLLDALGIAKAHIVGASMGGMIGQLVTANAPDRVHSFTSIMSSSGKRRLPAAKPEILSAMVRRTTAQNDPISERMMMLKLISSPGFPTNEDELREKVLAGYRRNYHPDGYTRQFAAIVHSGSRVRTLKTITRPTLVIHGKADPLIPMQAGIDTARHIRDAKLELIEGMGHDLPKQLIPRLVDSISAHASKNHLVQAT